MKRSSSQNIILRVAMLIRQDSL